MVSIFFFPPSFLPHASSTIFEFINFSTHSLMLVAPKCSPFGCPISSLNPSFSSFNLGCSLSSVPFYDTIWVKKSLLLHVALSLCTYNASTLSQRLLCFGRYMIAFPYQTVMVIVHWSLHCVFLPYTVIIYFSSFSATSFGNLSVKFSFTFIIMVIVEVKTHLTSY